MAINSRDSKVRSSVFLHPLQSNRGFTIVELIVVCAILGVLATMVLNSVGDLKQRVYISRAAAEIRSLEKDIFAYVSEKGSYPPDVNAVGVETLKNAVDPWGNAYVYSLIPTRTWVGPLNTDFDLYSKGPDGASTVPSTLLGDGADDIIRGGDGSFAGAAAKYP
jgi:general secretion pathway protein G